MKKSKLLDKYCNCCNKQLNTWDVRCSKALAYKNPVCEQCISKEYDIDVDALRAKMERVFGMRPCMGI